MGFGGMCAQGSGGMQEAPRDPAPSGCRADYGKLGKTMPREVQKRQNWTDSVFPQELRCPQDTFVGCASRQQPLLSA